MALARAATQSALDHTDLWLLLAAVLVGFAAIWLAFEVRRAWSPESLRSDGDTPPAPAPPPTDALQDLMPKLVEEVAQIRAELAVTRASEVEQALRARVHDLRAVPQSPATTSIPARKTS